MTDDLRARLKEDQQIIDAATEGPWYAENAILENFYTAVYYASHNGDTMDRDLIAHVPSSPARDGYEPDAEFIAASRTRWEQANRALLAVLEMHRPVFAVFNWRDGSRYEEPCEDCHGAKGEHPCGCWSRDEPDYRCYACETAVETKYSAYARWPCPTVKAIQEAME